MDIWETCAPSCSTFFFTAYLPFSLLLGWSELYPFTLFSGSELLIRRMIEIYMPKSPWHIYPSSGFLYHCSSLFSSFWEDRKNGSQGLSQLTKIFIYNWLTPLPLRSALLTSGLRISQASVPILLKNWLRYTSLSFNFTLWIPRELNLSPWRTPSKPILFVYVAGS